MIIINPYQFGVSYSAEVQSVFAKMPNPLTDFEKIGIAAFVDQMVIDGNWSKLDYFYGFFLSDIDNACTSWIGTKTATRVNSPTHDSKGFLFNGSTQYIDWNINLSTGLTNATLNDNYACSYLYVAPTIRASFIHGYYDTVTPVRGDTGLSGGAGQIIWTSNAATVSTITTTIVDKKRYANYRDSATENKFEEEGVTKFTQASRPSVAFTSIGFYSGAQCRDNVAAFHADVKESYSFLGGGFNLTTLQTACSALNTYFGLDV